MIAYVDLIRDLESLPPLSAVAVKLARVAEEARADAGEIAAIVRYDRALTAQLLEQAQRLRAPAGLSRPVIDLQDAILGLGLPSVLRIAVQGQLAPRMKAALPGYGLAEGELWRHGIAAALAVQALGRISAAPLPVGTETAALLHDIGKIMLSSYVNEAWRPEMAGLSATRKIPFSQVELEILGVNHPIAGARMSAQWGMGMRITEAVRRHHDAGSPEDLLIDAVRIANLAAKVAGCGLGAQGMSLGGDAAACGRMGVTRQDFESLCAEVHAELPRALQASSMRRAVS